MYQVIGITKGDEDDDDEDICVVGEFSDKAEAEFLALRCRVYMLIRPVKYRFKENPKAKQITDKELSEFERCEQRWKDDHPAGSSKALCGGYYVRQT